MPDSDFLPLGQASAQPPPITLVDLLRHGAPVGGQRYRGGSDDPLSDQGWQQMWAAVADSSPWDRIISSPLRRCAAFASELAQRLDLPLTQEPRLREIGFGSWEGKSAEQLIHQDPQALERFYRDPLANQPVGAEPPRAFVMRVGKALDELVAQHQGEHLLLVVHSGVIRAATAHILQIPLGQLFHIKVELAHFTRLQFGGIRPPTLVFHGISRLAARD